jgi:hypothetical protein
MMIAYYFASQFDSQIRSIVQFLSLWIHSVVDFCFRSLVSHMIVVSQEFYHIDRNGMIQIEGLMTNSRIQTCLKGRFARTLEDFRDAGAAVVGEEEMGITIFHRGCEK